MNTLRVLSFNAWILRAPLIGGKEVPGRFRELPDRLAGTQADILMLQEIWHPRDRQALHAALRPFGFSYAFHRRKNLADGMMILSRYPGSETRFLEHQYGAKGWERFLHKGTQHVTIDHPALGDVDLVNIHLQAATDSQVRRQQIERIMEWLPTSRHQVLAGDFNFPYRIDGRPHPAYKWFTEIYAMQDAYREVHGTETDDATYDFRQNPFAVDGPELGAIDYIFYRSDSLITRNAAILFREKPVLSDHFGVLASFASRN